MNKKISLGFALGIIILTIAVSGAVTAGVVNKQYNNILSGLPEKLDRYAVIDELDDIINKNYYGNSGNENIEQALAQGYVGGLGDKNSKYMSAGEYDEYKSEIDGNMSGIGIKYEKTNKSQIKITGVYAGSPAQSCGLKKNDIIVAFDGIRVTSGNYNEMAEKLKGDKLSSVNITYKHGKTENTVNVVKGYEAQSVVTDVYNGVGYMEITNFFSSTAGQVKSAVSQLISSNIKALVIDLRNNTSINYENAIKTLDIFVPMSQGDKPAAKVIDEEGNTVKEYQTSSDEVNMPVAILVSGETQSAAELFACDMRDFSKAAIFGDGNTKGDNLVQEIFELSSGGAVLLSTGKILPYASESFDGVGIVPDYQTELKENADDISQDSQFLYAVSVISGTAQS